MGVMTNNIVNDIVEKARKRLNNIVSKMHQVHPSTVHPREPSQCIQYTLFILNVLFWLVGVILIVAGSYVIVEIKDYYKDLADLSFQPSLLLLCIGGLIFVITFIGCIGALRQNTTLLNIYTIIIALMLLIMIAAAVLGFLFKDKLEAKVKDNLKSAITHYRDPKRLDLQNIIDVTQTELQCCGVESYKDWDNNIYFNCSAPGVEKCGVPYTCCKQDLQLNRQCGYGVRQPAMKPSDRSNKIYTYGCLQKATVWLSDNLILIGGISIGVLALQLLSMFLAITLRGQVEEVKRRH